MNQAAAEPSIQRRLRRRSWLASRSRGECPPGAVLLHAPSFAFQAPGGGENQLVQTGRHLEDAGRPGPALLRVDRPPRDGPAAPSLRDVARGARAGAGGEGARACRSCCRRSAGTSPGPWPRSSPISLRKTREPGGLGPAARRARGSRAGGASCSSLADVVLPNSRSEATQLVRLFGVARERVRVVPNGVLPSVGSASPELFPRAMGAGSVRPLRGTDRAAQEHAGPDPGHSSRWGCRWWSSARLHPAFARYAQECRRAGGDQVVWLGRLDHHDPLLASAYAAARVFALPSWFETPGLAALEAALAGCAVVITPYGSTREYFGDLVEYARPHRPDEIRRAVAKCWDDGPDPRLARRVATHYLWPKVAQITAEVYDQVAR